MDWDNLDAELGRVLAKPPANAVTVYDVAERYQISRHSARNLLEKMRREGRMKSDMFFINGRWMRLYWKD